MKQPILNQVKCYLIGLQQKICQIIEQEDGSTTFGIDNWQRDAGGGGKTCVLSGGEIIEKGGVNFSHVFGTSLPASAITDRPTLTNRPFQAMGISIVLHPRNPYVPTTHANLRLFCSENEANEAIWWFGGGFDLTPYYPFREDCIHWHTMARQACEPFGSDIYHKYKQWCDEYFYLKHRQETRGIGGLFFDNVNQWDFHHCFDFVKSVGDHFLPAYQPILQERKQLPYGERERDFQAYRRGRYAEFNLIYDRGTLFGLQSNGRTESILMSLPPQVKWHYDWQPDENSEEAVLTREYLKVQDWLEA